MKFQRSIPIAFVLAALSGSCGERGLAASEVDPLETPWVEFAGWESMEREQFLSAAEQRLVDLDARLLALYERIGEEHRETMSELEQARQAAGEQLDAVQRATAEAWRDGRARVADTIDRIGNAIDRLAVRHTAPRD